MSEHRPLQSALRPPLVRVSRASAVRTTTPAVLVPTSSSSTSPASPSVASPMVIPSSCRVSLFPIPKVPVLPLASLLPRVMRLLLVVVAPPPALVPVVATPLWPFWGAAWSVVGLDFLILFCVVGLCCLLLRGLVAAGWTCGLGLASLCATVLAFVVSRRHIGLLGCFSHFLFL